MQAWLMVIGILSLAAAGVSAAPSLSQAKQIDESLLCKLEVLPDDFKSSLTTRFSSWKVQEPSNLTPSARGRWESEKPLTCPGIAVGEFETPGKSTYAVLLVPKHNPDSAYKLLVYSPPLPDRFRTLEEWGQGQAANYFIHPIVIAKVFSKDWTRKLSAATRDGILVAEAGKNEYGIDVYFWSKGQYRHEPIDH